MNKPGPRKKSLSVSHRDRVRLQRILKKPDLSEAMRLRVRIILSEGELRSQAALAHQLQTTAATIIKWRKRYREAGIEGLKDYPRKGRPVKSHPPSGNRRYTLKILEKRLLARLMKTADIPNRIRLRAKVLLECEQAASAEAIAQKTGASLSSVRRWQKQFARIKSELLQYAEPESSTRSSSTKLSVTEGSSVEETVKTTRELAQIARLSHTTVSLALRNDKRVSLSTRRKVQELADKYGYHAHPWMTAWMSHVRTRGAVASPALCYISLEKSSERWKEIPFRRLAIEGASQRCRELGYQFEQIWAWEKGMTPKRLAQILNHRGINGVLMSSFYHRTHEAEQWINVLQSFACVSVGLRYAKPTIPFAMNDQHGTGQLIYSQLRQRGYQKIGIVLPRYQDAIIDHRFSSGFRAACSLDGSIETLSFCHLPYHKTKQYFLEWLYKSRVDVVVTSALSVKGWLEEENINVPGDMGFVFSHCDEISENWSGTFQNTKAVGAISVDMIAHQLSGRPHYQHLPHAPVCGSLLESHWVDGDTLV